MQNSKLKRRIICALVAALVAATAAFPVHVLAVTLEYEDSKLTNPVADNITRLDVNKLRKDQSHDAVPGAHLAIIEKETGKVVTEWISDGSMHEVSRNAESGANGALDIDVVYILRELEAPEGFEKAEDVEFVIHSDNFNTSGEILSGGDNGNADSSEIRGSGPEQAFVINLYDEATVNVEDTETRTNKKDNESEKQIEQQKEKEAAKSTTATAENLTKTGDDTSYLPIIALAAAGAAVIVVALIKRKKDGGNDK